MKDCKSNNFSSESRNWRFGCGWPFFCWEDDTTLHIRRDSEIDQSRTSMKKVYVEMGYVYKFSWLTLVLPTKWSGSEHLEPNQLPTQTAGRVMISLLSTISIFISTVKDTDSNVSMLTPKKRNAQCAGSTGRMDDESPLRGSCFYFSPNIFLPI